jgi:hypothetical protein
MALSINYLIAPALNKIVSAQLLTILKTRIINGLSFLEVKNYFIKPLCFYEPTFNTILKT